MFTNDVLQMHAYLYFVMTLEKADLDCFPHNDFLSRICKTVNSTKDNFGL